MNEHVPRSSAAWILAGCTTLFHLLTAIDSYGIFRDELYYVANGRHLALGYVDHPPLIGWISGLVTHLFGDSLLALRFLPALAAGVTVFLVCSIVREMGGGRPARILAGIATALAPVYVATFGYFSMNAFDVLLWAAAVLIVTRLLRTRDLRLWVPFGIVAGLGLETKISMLFLGFGMIAGLVLTHDWECFRRRWIWIAGVIALMLFAPYLAWQATHDWATVEFIRRATQYKNLPLSPLEFLSAQILQMNPVAVPLAVGALVFFFFTSRGRTYRALGWGCLAIFVVMVLQRAKPYYFSPALTMLFSGGAVGIEHLTRKRGFGWLQPTYPALLALSGFALVPFAKPVLPIETFVRYQAALGLAPGTDERHELERLPQFFADRRGWHELAETVADVYHRLPPEEQAVACIFGQNYGQAGAIDYFGPDLGLPHAISGHNSYWWWGHGDCSGEVVIVMGGRREDHLQVFDEVELATTWTCNDCMPYENNKPIWVCRRARVGIDEIWPRLRHYD